MWVEPTFKLNLKALSSQDNQNSDTVSTSKKDETTQVVDITPNLKIDSPLKTKEEWVLENSDISVWAEQEVKKVKKENIKSHNISFADIRKQIEKKNSSGELDIEEIDTTDSDNQTDSSTEIKNESVVALPDNTGVTDNLWNLKVEDWVENDNNSENLKAKTIGASAVNTNTNESEAKNWKAEDNTTEITLNEDKEAQKDKIAIENAEKTKAILREKEEKKSEKKKSFFSRFKRKKWDKKKEVIPEESKENIASHANLQDVVLDENLDDKTIPKQEDTSPEKIIEKVHFSNYESHFKKESTNFLKKFQNFKYAPSTRIWMILWLVWLTCMIITVLMVFFPEKHSLEIYKASILEISGKSTGNIEIEEEVNHTVTPTEELIIPIDNELELEQESENEVSDNFTESEEEISVEESSKEKLRQHLFNKYK